ncbi:glucan ABC transporter ATP-binding protein/ permease [Enterovirga sp.]|uniref:glucan ABC transporter ATP-binding protein/ permease n=1 Tax=Enterovirga sp. TaxID=2026350 RepID=UPI002C91B0D5|nr:glucan ABC transporter ATP-binding protein/ permease [Enterovirga sp.]HMO28412.1 glucan ABC transporter ATP-binding protein/ permease [Enterovirga sp.]
MWMIRLYSRVLWQLGSDLRIGAVLALANIALAVATFAEPILFGKIIDLLSQSASAPAPISFGTVLPYILAWVGFGLFTIAAGVLIGLHADRLSHRRRLAVMATYFEHVLELPLAFHTSTHSGRVLKVMLEGSTGMSWLWLGFFREHFAALVSLCVLLPLTLFLNWRLASLLVALIIVFAIMTTYVLRKTEQLQGQVEDYHSLLAEQASDALGNVPVIQSFTRVKAETTQLRKTITQLLAAQTPVLSWWAIANIGTRASATLTVTSIFLFGTFLNLTGYATIGEVVMFMSIAQMLIAKLEHVVSFVNSLFMQAPKMRQFFEILDTAPSVHDKPGAQNIERFKGAVEFEDVSFSYDGKRTAIADLSFGVQPGENVALVGSTGSGKSTTLGLLHRAFDPQSGIIRIDGVDIRDITLASLRRNIGVVFQEPMLFARSIRENLQVGRPDATEAEMREALERAQASEFIQRQADGLDSVIGERGRSLSGGERQRLSIARALLKNPPVLILDEATSALDAATEKKLQAALEEVMKGRTTFVIAHRLATIRNADRILVFDAGRVVESGTFDELVAQGGRFAELAKAQFMASADEDRTLAPPPRLALSHG